MCFECCDFALFLVILFSSVFHFYEQRKEDFVTVERL